LPIFVHIWVLLAWFAVERDADYWPVAFALQAILQSCLSV